MVKPRTRYYDELRARVFNLQKPSRAFLIGRHHYDIGNTLYRLMLDERMIYSCGYWEAASTLDEAQEAKLNLVGRKLKLQPGMRILDIGCGWGGTAKYVAERYIFPNSMLPSARQISSAIEGVFVLEDWHSFGADYDKTLMHWFQNFHKNWDMLKEAYDERFYRMWKYYLLSGAGAFRARSNQLWQIILSPKGFPGGYRIPRFRFEKEPPVKR